MKKTLTQFIFAVLLLMPLHAAASTITITQLDIGKGFTVLASGEADPGGETVSAKLDALVADYFYGATTTTLVLDITLANTSPGDSSLRGYGFSANPNVQTGTATGTEYGFDFVSTLLNTNPSVGDIENCVAGISTNNCQGLPTGAGGLEFGQVDTHTLSLVFNGQLASLQLGDAKTGMYFRFQSVGTAGGSAKIFGNPPGVPTTQSTVPDGGATLGLLGLGLVGMGYLRRRMF